MRYVHMTTRQAREALSVLLDPDISAVRQEDDALREQCEVQALLEDIERDLATRARAEVQSPDGLHRRRLRRVRRTDSNVVPLRQEQVPGEDEEAA